MKHRIAIWAIVGAFVVVLWDLYISATPSAPSGVARTLIALTCPIALARQYALGFYFVLAANAFTYALVGALVEILRRHHKQTQLLHTT